MRSKQAPFPFSREITVDLIASAGDKLWKELLGTDESRKTPFKITNVQLSFSGIESMETGQRSIEGFFSNGSPSTTPTKSSRMKRKRKERDNDMVDLPFLVAHSVDEPVTVASSANAKGGSRSNSTSFLCDRCKKRISLPEKLDDMDDDIKGEAMASLRQEHEDWHFAQELARQPTTVDSKLAIRPSSKPGSGSGSNASDRQASKGRKRLKAKDSQPDKGIAKFFSKS